MTSAKRRRFTRYEINLVATLAINNSDYIQCVIRDFCSGGMFIELPQGKGLSALSQQQSIHIHFSVNHGQGSEDLSQKIIIMHISAIGIGVAFEENSEIIFKALVNESKKNIKPGSTDQINTLTHLAKREKLETGFSLLFQETLTVVINNFYKVAESRIKQELNNAGDYRNYNALTDANTLLQVKKETVINSFCNLSPTLFFIAPPSAKEEIDKTEIKPKLSLVDKDEFEDWLNLSAIIRSLDALFEYKLNILQEKIALILKVDKEQANNPFSPTNLCEHFRDALTEIEADDQIKKHLYSVFGEILAKLLPAIYEKMDNILSKYGGKIEISSDDIAQKNKSSSKQTTNASPTERFPSDSDFSSSNASVNRPSSTQPNDATTTRHIVDVASHLLNLAQTQNTTSHTSVSTTNTYSEAEINTVLAHLQQRVIDNDAQNLTFPDLRKELQKTLIHPSPSKKKLSATDKNNIAVYDSLFETLFNEKLLTQGSQEHLQQIYMPIMAQAIQNPHLLESENHPARNIINHLSRLESVIDNNKAVKNLHIKEFINQLVKQVSTKSIDDPTVFASVEQKLHELTQSVDKSIEQNIKRIQDVYQGKQKLKQAQKQVQNDLTQQFGDKKVPKIIITMLEAGWRHLLIINKLNSKPKIYTSHLRTIANLNACLTGQKSINRKLTKMLIKVFDKNLQSVCINSSILTNIKKELKNLLLKNGIQHSPETMELLSIEQNNPLPTRSSIQIDEVDHLVIGEWLTFLLEEEVEPLKLVWISEDHDQFVFVNRAGMNKLELEYDDLAELIKSGAANRVESLDFPVMDRANNAMLQNLHEKLIYNATRDVTTGLLNQKEFIKQLKQELINIDNSKYLLCNIEIQDFRIITNACGLSGEEALLKQLSDLIKQHGNNKDIQARINDRTFSVLLKNSPSKAAKQLHTQLISNEFKWQDKRYAIAVSMGIVPLYSAHNYDLDTVLQNIDSATLLATSSGKNQIRVYKDDDASIKSQFNEREWVGQISQVLAENRLFLRCQQIAAIEPETESHTHYEILLGIKDEAGKTIPPDDFIPAVERCQRMSEIDQWVVLSVFEWIEQNLEAFKELNGFSINLSGESMNSKAFLEFLEQTLSSSKVPLDKITFEITETVAADSFQFIQSFITKIKQYKCKFSLDDFGSGYSSYSYLKSLDVDYLKIDGIFVKDLLNNNTDIAIVTSMNEIAHSLQLKTIAEYVENDAIKDVLKEIGVDYAQGWGVEKPKLINELSKETAVI